jgi:tetratricopeptide (TPR) repeat protein
MYTNRCLFVTSKDSKLLRVKKDVVIPTRLSTNWLNPKNIRTVNIQYSEAKGKFRTASKSKLRKDWEDAFEAYKKYCNEIYPQDIDALEEFGEICTQLDHNGDYIDWAIECFEKARGLEKHNFLYKIRLGESYVRKRKWSKALEFYEDLHNKEPKNKTFLLNCAVICIKLQKHPKYESKLRDYVNKFSELFDKDPITPSLQASLKGKDVDHKIQYTKGKGGDQRRQLAEQRLGVLIMLQMFSSASKNQIKEKWLINANTTTQILRELIDSDYIEVVPEVDANMRYRNKDQGAQYAERYLQAIFAWIDDKGKEPLELGAVFTDRLIDHVKEWDKIADFRRKVLKNEKKG